VPPLLSSMRQVGLTRRAVQAWTSRGSRYVWHKALRRTPGRWVVWKRGLLYKNPRDYWTLRGGDDYFREQEDHPWRGARMAWIAQRVEQYAPTSILEVGCGYGKLLRALRERITTPLVGVDFSRTQLSLARRYVGDLPDVTLLQGDGSRLPFPDDTFDLVLTSAVILHNRSETAEAIRRELLRVARRWVTHNEDTDVSYNRFGYDTAEWYRSRGVPLAECGPIPVGPPEEVARSQFCVARIGPEG